VKNLVTTNELAGSRVIGGKRGTRRIGKTRYFVFHPTEKRVLGFIVKRPDLLWMFRRKDWFVSIEGYDLIDGRICVRNSSDATGYGAYQALGVDPDECVLWIGLPIMTKDGESLGFVGNVVFNQVTGTVYSVESDSGAAANTLLGRREIPAEMVKGFHRGMGTALSLVGEGGSEGSEVALGALLVSDRAKALEVEGGLAEKAGKGAAVIADKAGRSAAVIADRAGKGAASIADKAGKASVQVSRAASSTAKTAEKAVNKGAYATGKQLGKAQGMFTAFKEEYDKARHDD
jgi:uncharacterized protein YrrD